MLNFFVAPPDDTSQATATPYEQMRDIPLFLQNQKSAAYDAPLSISDIWINRISS